MGLDCTAYEIVTLVRACDTSDLTDDDWTDIDRSDHIVLYNVPAFRARSDQMPDGIYSHSGKRIDWHTSYTGYNRFREEVSHAALGVSPRTVWADPDVYASSPLIPLINFSDAEGFLGPETCARLAADVDKVNLHFDDYYQEWWETWIEMFGLASGAGAIRFH